ncbi:MAG: helix-turn-helix domain-containing protein [Bacteroidales bacterium]|nr:helix-turn-helix domain-containing protein [Bacteroidales bacterium]MCM1415952.1 helix-turn-helix domain-containing protein [bacterium]MCM1422779.1 helix-turn-helix domain-containing protein [bacterium]
MSLGQNLQFLRKRDNITQEQLAESLEVSRQSVSKWESDTSYPEMDKLLQLTDFFHCTLDDLVKQDVSEQYVEDKYQYDSFFDKFSRQVTLGVGLIMTGLTSMIFLMGILPERPGLDTEALAATGFFIFIAIAVTIFVVAGLQSDRFEKEHPYIEDFYTKEERDAFQKKFIKWIASGIVFIFFGIILAIGFDFVFTEKEVAFGSSFPSVDTDMLTGAVFMLCLTVSVILFTYAGTQESRYNIRHYNLIHDRDSQTYKYQKKTGMVCGCIMMIATILFLILGFLTAHWEYAAPIYATFGIACGIAAVIINRNNPEKE